MKKKFSKILCFLLITMLLLGLCQCITRCSVTLYQKVNHGWAMRALAMKTIPQYVYHSHDDLRVVEMDQYGRYLYSVDHGQDAKRAFIVVQKEDKENGYVYYYETESTLLVDDLFNLSVEEENQIELLKQKNDWGHPLHEAKMTYIVVE